MEIDEKILEFGGDDLAFADEVYETFVPGLYDETDDYEFSDDGDDGDDGEDWQYIGEDGEYEYFACFSDDDGEYENLFGKKARARRKKRKEKRVARRKKRKTKRIARKIKKAEKKGKTAKVKRLKKRTAKVTKRLDKRAKKIDKRFEKKEKRAEKRKKIIKKVTQKIKTAFPVAVAARGAFMALLRLNIWGAASDMKKEKDKRSARYTRARDKWYKLGGNRTKFDKSVDVGAKKRPLKIKWKKSKGADGYDEDTMYFNISDTNDPPFDLDNDYLNVAGETAAMLTTAIPVIVAIFKAFGKKPGDMDTETQQHLISESEEMAPEFYEQVNEEAKLGIPEDKRDEEELDFKTGLPLWAKISIGVAGAGLIAGILYAVLKKKNK